MTQAALPTVAQVTCVRDEEAFLAPNLHYHRALGVTRAYVILDRCTDRSAEIARSLPWVRVIERDRTEAEAYLPHYLSNRISEAFALARDEGFDWLLAVDADEFASGEAPCSDRGWQARGLAHATGPEPARRGNLPNMLAGVGDDTEVVLLRTIEVVPQRLDRHEPFWKNHFVQLRQKPAAFRRRMPDAPGGELHRRHCWFGHDQGKTLARTSADLRLRTTHKWQRASGSAAGSLDVVRIERAGFHYHFNISDAEQWLRKYRGMAEFPDHWPSGKKVRFPKQAWKVATQNLSDEAARAYYREWIAASPGAIARAFIRGRIAWDPYVERVLARAGGAQEPGSVARGAL